ncbi:hypothetical protein BVY05_00645 [Pectobacterium odoriferum]|nr:hypothetical protein BVY05_00645 [Pectobacterium odoriferum]
MPVRWPRSLSRITYLSKFTGIPSLATCLKLELFSGYLIVCFSHTLCFHFRRMQDHLSCHTVIL